MPKTLEPATQYYVFYTEKYRLQLCLLLSILLHLVLLNFLLKTPGPKSTTEALWVDLTLAPQSTQEISTPKRQIVSEPEAPESASQAAKFLAEKDHKAVKEQLKRGTAPNAGPAIAKNLHTPVKPQNQPQVSNQQDLDLALDSKTLLQDFGEIRPPKQSSPITKSLDNYKAFSRPVGSGAAFLGTSGVSDFIPNLPDGDITMLNTKADQYAVFVRRVAIQVFGQLRSQGWDTLRSADINTISQPTIVRATLSASGELLNVEILASSGSSKFDATVDAAVKRGAKDPNPPKGAQTADGVIKFIFKSQSWVRYFAGNRNGAAVERRWVMLGTGLE